MGTPIISLLDSVGGGGGSLPPKVINVPADFPTIIEANADIGRIYIAAANVTDNDPTKTNTGQSFLSGEEFVWDGISAYFKLGANALWLDDGTDYKTISPARNLDLQNKDLKNVANATIGNLTVQSATNSSLIIVPYSDRIELDFGLNITDVHFNRATADVNYYIHGTSATDPVFYVDADQNNIGLGTDTPDSSYILDANGSIRVLGALLETTGTFKIAGSGEINAIVTSISGASTHLQLPSALAVWNAVQVENIWDRDTSGTPYIKPNTTGDHLHLNDEESTSFATSEFQIFKNSGADASLWSSSAVATEDANLNLVRSRGTIGTPTAVQDNDLIGNINFIGYDGGAFRNGAEINAEINGSISSGVLPCDLVFYINTGAGVTTEGMRLDKNKNLTVVGDVGLTGTRISKIWATNVESTNYPSVNGTALSDQYLATTDTPSFAQLTVDNLVLNANTLSSTSGDIQLSPTDSVIINGHWEFDGKTLVAISDSDTTFTAYAGKNIIIEGVTFDGGIVGGISALAVADMTFTASGILNESSTFVVRAGNGENLSLESTSGDAGLSGATVTLNSITTNITLSSNTTIDIFGDSVDITADALTLTGSSTISGGQFVNVTTVNVATYDLLATDYILNVTYTTTGAVTSLTIPDAQFVIGRIIHIKDAGFNAGTNSITLDTVGATKKIEGNDTLVISGDGEVISLYCADSNNFFVF